MEQEYEVPVTPLNCLDLNADGIAQILQSVLYQFPIREIAIEIPRWIVALEAGHWLKNPLCGGASGRFRHHQNVGAQRASLLPARLRVP